MFVINICEYFAQFIHCEVLHKATGSALMLQLFMALMAMRIERVYGAVSWILLEEFKVLGVSWEISIMSSTWRIELDLQ